MMDESIKNELLKAGVSLEAIAVLEEQGYDTEASLQNVAKEELQAAGVEKGGDRSKIKVAFPNLTDKPDGPQMVIVQSNKPEDKTLTELLQLLATGESGLEIKAVVQEKTKGLDCFVRNTQGNIDIASTLACLEHLLDTGSRLEFWGGVPVESLDEIIAKKKEADPLNGDVLVGGRSTDGLDWSDVSDDKRVLIAYARQQNLLPLNFDRFAIVAELQSLELSNPTGRWMMVQASFKKDEKNRPEIIAAARVALIYRKKGGAGAKSPYGFPRTF